MPKHVDEAMVQRLIYGPDPGANGAERRAAVEILLKRGQEESYRCIADRVGVDRRTVDRVAVRLGLSKTRPRALVEIGACETRAELWQLLHRGHAPAGAARSLGISYSTAYGHVRKLRRIGVL